MEKVLIFALIIFAFFAIFFFKKASEMDETDETDAYGRTAQDYRKFGWCYIGFGVAVVLVVLMISSAFGVPLFSSNNSHSSSKNSPKDYYSHDKFDAITVAESVVEERLKSPSTAKFCSVSDYTVTLDGDTWTIEGYVDAQNSFGATLRNNFTIRITFESSTIYTIDSCIIN